ncbi:MAG: hypothetical protein AB8B81_16620 [Halioglobus sp.]
MKISQPLAACILLIITLLVACGGNSGGGDSSFSDPANAEGVPLDEQVTIEVETTNTITGRSTNVVNSLEPMQISVQVRNGRNRAVTGSIVSLSTTLGQLDTASGDILIDSQGIATTNLTVFDEFPGSAGALVASHLDESKEVFFTVQKAPALIGATHSGGFTEGTIDVLAPTISEGGETLLSISIRDTQGNSLTRAYTANFSSECTESTPPLASIGRVDYSIGGIASALYTAEGCTGTDVISVEIAGLVGHYAEGRVLIRRPGATAITYAGADSAALNLAESNNENLPDETLVFFKVVDKTGQPVPNIPVAFGLSSTIGGIKIESESVLTDAAGVAGTRLKSGSIPTAVRVSAKIREDAKELTAISESIFIRSGRPNQSAFSIAADTLNPGGDLQDGVTANLSISAADRFNSPVPDGTVVFFRTEYGGVKTSCTTESGVCTVPWRSQAPRQPLFSEFTDDDGNSAFVRTLYNTNCPSGGNSRGKPCPDFLGHPIGARTTIQAYTTGDEAFVDANANGLYDSGERFEDLPEAFLDHNEDGEFGNSTTIGSCHPNCNEPGGSEEVFIDIDENGRYSEANGVYNGSLCTTQAINEKACDPNPVTVSDSIVILASGSRPHGAFYNGTIKGTSPAKSVSIGGVDRALLFYVSDKYNGKLPEGTTVEISATGCALSGKQSFSIADSNSTGPSIFPITVKGSTNDEALSGWVLASVTVPSNGTAIIDTFSLPCSVDACSIQPAPTFCSADSG